jgi:hypothetical protein
MRVKGEKFAAREGDARRDFFRLYCDRRLYKQQTASNS